jgi:hypothetical protein
MCNVFSKIFERDGLTRLRWDESNTDGQKTIRRRTSDYFCTISRFGCLIKSKLLKREEILHNVAPLCVNGVTLLSTILHFLATAPEGFQYPLANSRRLVLVLPEVCHRARKPSSKTYEEFKIYFKSQGGLCS